MRKICLIMLISTLATQLFAQDAAKPASTKNVYSTSVSEIIFSWGSVKDKNLEPFPKNVLRFTLFLHLGYQLHKDLNDKVGFYSGISMRNIGTINDLNDTVRVKQRTYTLGVPLAFKFGNMKGAFAAVGAEAEFAFWFRQKVFENQEKSRTNIWFGNRTNVFLPSVFAEVKFQEGFYLRFRYYLSDFLNPNTQRINVPNVSFNPTKSQLMYASFGFSMPNRKMKKYNTPRNSQM